MFRIFSRFLPETEKINYPVDPVNPVKKAFLFKIESIHYLFLKQTTRGSTLMTLEEKIIGMLDQQKISYEIVEHEPVYTNPAMAEALKVDESETVKSLVLKTKEGKMIVLVLPGNKKVNWKEAAAGAGTKKVSFAKPDEVSESVGCEVGCVPPFGHFSTLPIYLDPELAKKDFVYFNPGVHDKSFKVKGWDLRKLCQT
jgi:Ala-tRNA(Pro) deacylase